VILSAQYRTHLFMVLIVGEYARLIRWDRGGVVITRRIRFDDESHLFDSLIRYDSANPENCGHDSTISSSSEDEIKRAKDIVPEFTKVEAYFSGNDITSRRKEALYQASSRNPTRNPSRSRARSSIACNAGKGRRVFLRILGVAYCTTYRNLLSAPCEQCSQHSPSLVVW